MPPKRSKASSFPAARIKRIMQQDDDVGKVAGASPTVMSKAIELFLHEMMQAMEQEAKSKGSKRISLYHLKRAVENTPSLDFLKDMVSGIPDPVGADDDDDDAPAKKKARTMKKANGNGGDARSNGKSSIKQSKSQVKLELSQAPGQAITDAAAVSVPTSSLLVNSAESATAGTLSDNKPKAPAGQAQLPSPKQEAANTSTIKSEDGNLAQDSSKDSKPASADAPLSERPDLQEDEDYD